MLCIYACVRLNTEKKAWSEREREKKRHAHTYTDTPFFMYLIIIYVRRCSF